MSDAPRATPALTRASTAAPGRLSIMALIGLAAGAMPLPFVPGAVLKRVRGALAHDVAARYGLSLTDEARREMAEPSRTARSGALLATVAFFARRTLRRFGVLGRDPAARRVARGVRARPPFRSLPRARARFAGRCASTMPKQSWCARPSTARSRAPCRPGSSCRRGKA